MDPRIARRWTEVRREQGRRRLRILVAAGSVAVVIGLFAGSLFTPLFKVRHVRVTVSGATPAAKVVALAGLDRQRLMINVHGAALEARLDAVAYLGGSRVGVHWPGTVTISVVERVPVAVVQVAVVQAPAAPPASPQWAEVDVTGRVLDLVPVAPAGRPVIQGLGVPPQPGQWLDGSPGPEVSASPPGPLVDMAAASDDPSAPSGVSAALAIIAAMPATLRADLQSIDVGGGVAGGLAMTMMPANRPTGPIAVRLGDGSRLAAKLTALGALFTQTNLSGVTSIDLTVPDRPAALTARQTPGNLSTHAGG